MGVAWLQEAGRAAVCTGFTLWLLYNRKASATTATNRSAMINNNLSQLLVTMALNVPICFFNIIRVYGYLVAFKVEMMIIKGVKNVSKPI